MTGSEPVSSALPSSVAAMEVAAIPVHTRLVPRGRTETAVSPAVEMTEHAKLSRAPPEKAAARFENAELEADRDLITDEAGATGFEVSADVAEDLTEEPVASRGRLEKLGLKGEVARTGVANKDVAADSQYGSSLPICGTVVTRTGDALLS